MGDEGIGQPKEDGGDAAPASRPLEGPGSEERLRALKARFQSREVDRMSTLQLAMIGLFVFLLILLFGAGRFVIADLAPKPPPGLDLNAPSPPDR
jgi:hypothetical protein